MNVTKTHWKNNFNYEYLGSYSLQNGGNLVLTIQSAKKEPVTGNKGKSEECLVFRFKEGCKPMIVNRTNCKIIEGLYGSPFVEDWVGKPIELTVEKVDAFGDTVDALRVVSRKPIIKKIVKPNSSLLDSLCKGLSTKQTTLDQIQEEYDMDPESFEKLKLIELQNEF